MIRACSHKLPSRLSTVVLISGNKSIIPFQSTPDTQRSCFFLPTESRSRRRRRGKGRSRWRRRSVRQCADGRFETGVPPGGRSGVSLAAENCVQHGTNQTVESAMSWGTELWVCLSFIRRLSRSVFGLLELWVAHSEKGRGKCAESEVPLYLFSFCVTWRAAAAAAELL